MKSEQKIKARGTPYADVKQVARMRGRGGRGLLQGGPARHGESFGPARGLEQGEGELSPEIRRWRRRLSAVDSLRAFYDDNDLDVDEQIDVLFDRVDDWLLAEDFERTNELFCVLREKAMHRAVEELDVTLALLTVTQGAQPRLPDRARFVEDLRDRMEDEMPPADVEAHLQGLD